MITWSAYVADETGPCRVVDRLTEAPPPDVVVMPETGAAVAAAIVRAHFAEGNAWDDLAAIDDRLDLLVTIHGGPASGSYQVGLDRAVTIRQVTRIPAFAVGAA